MRLSLANMSLQLVDNCHWSTLVKVTIRINDQSSDKHWQSGKHATVGIGYPW
jgi:hypothetical protein